MAETLRDGDELLLEYFDAERSARVPLDRSGELTDLGSTFFPWGLDSARAPNNTHVDLIFGGPVSILWSVLYDPTSYVISPSLAVKSAAVVGTYVIQLETARQSEGVTYTVSIPGIRSHA